MPIIDIVIKNKIAHSPEKHIVCGNSDYIFNFIFDEEWNDHEIKTARFAYGGNFTDVVFNGNTCPAPVISNTTVCTVGVFAGDLKTTTPALVTCDKSILCDGGVPADPTPDVYAQIMELLKNGASEEQIANAVNDYLTKHPITETDPNVPDWAKQKEKPTYTAKDVGALSQDELQSGVDKALQQAKESGEFNGKDGKDGKDGINGNDYVLTESDKQDIADIVANEVLGVIENGSY